MALLSKRLNQEPQLVKAENNSPFLKQGDQGKGVAIIQDLLADLGERAWVKTFSKKEADGIFGTETLAAVKAFQKRKNLKVDGIVGKLTLQALDREILANPRLELREGRRDYPGASW